MFACACKLILKLKRKPQTRGTVRNFVHYNVLYIRIHRNYFRSVIHWVILCEEGYVIISRVILKSYSSFRDKDDFANYMDSTVRL